jgi:hypothetical protein
VDVVSRGCFRKDVIEITVASHRMCQHVDGWLFDRKAVDRHAPAVDGDDGFGLAVVADEAARTRRIVGSDLDALDDVDPVLRCDLPGVVPNRVVAVVPDDDALVPVLARG